MKRIREEVQSKAAMVMTQHDQLSAQLRIVFPDISEEHLNQIATGAVLMAMSPSGSVRQVYLDVMALGVQASDMLSPKN